MTNVDVVEKDILRHGPKLNTNTTLFILMSTGRRRENGSNSYNLSKALNGCKVFEVIWVGDLARGPLALVGGVIDHGGVPFALEGWIWLVGAKE